MTAAEFTFDDRVLAHLQIVVSASCGARRVPADLDRPHRAPEGICAPSGSIRRSACSSPSRAPTLPEIQREWLEILTEKANSSPGLWLDDDLRAEIREELPQGTAKAQRGRRDQRVPTGG